MKIDNPLDKHLESVRGRLPIGMTDAVVWVADTLDIAWLATQSVFESRATPELALQVFDRICARQAQVMKSSE